MIITIQGFGGEMPRIAPHLLPPNAAQIAANVTLSTGDLKSQLGVSAAIKLAGGLTNVKGAFFTDDGNFFAWTDERTMAKSTVIDDFYQRCYYTDGTAYLRFVQQFLARTLPSGVGVWDASETYALGAYVTYPGTVPANWAVGTPYSKGDMICRPNAATAQPSHNRVWRARVDMVAGIDPLLTSGYWDLFSPGILYKSLANGNTAKTPTEFPTWWIPYGASLVGLTARAGVPAPAAYNAKTGSTYNVNVVTGDPDGTATVYNVPQTIADERAAVDVAEPTNALIAVARNTLIDNTVLRDSPTGAANTGVVYYGIDGLKLTESVVTMLPIEAGRLYSFTPPAKSTTINEVEVSEIWVEEGDGRTTGVITPETTGG